MVNRSNGVARPRDNTAGIPINRRICKSSDSPPSRGRCFIDRDAQKSPSACKVDHDDVCHTDDVRSETPRDDDALSGTGGVLPQKRSREYRRARNVSR
jgi:hypothetical protein